MPWLSSRVATRMHAGVAWTLIGAGFNQGSTMIVNLAVANLLGREAFGRYTMVLATLTTVAAIGQLSMGYTATRHIAEFRSTQPDRASRILTLCALVSLVSATVAGGLLAISSNWLARVVLEAPELSLLLRLAAAAVFFAVLNGFSTGALAGLESYRALARVGIASGTLYAVVCIVLARSFGLTGAVSGLGLSAAVQCVLLGVTLARQAAGNGIRIARHGWWEDRALVSNFALPASLGGVLTLPAIWIAGALLGRQAGGYHQLALFGAANTFRTVVLFVPQAVNNVGMSILNHQRRVSADGYSRVFRWNAFLTASSALGAAAVLLLLGGPLLQLFGPTFIEGRNVLAILLGAAVIEALAIALYQVVVSHRRIWASLVFVSLPRDITLVVAAALLTPLWGAAGLGTAYVAGWMVALTGIVALIFRYGMDASHRMPLSAA